MIKPLLSTATFVALLSACNTTLPEPAKILSNNPDVQRLMGAEWRKVADIQREGNYYYRINRKVQSAVYGNRPEDIKPQNMFKVLPKNATGSCTHTVAVKIKMIREKMPYFAGRTFVLVYDQPISNDLYVRHAAVLIDRPWTDRFVILNNLNQGLDDVATLDGFRNHKVMTYEAALAKYN